jgi:acyl-CoA dehydrogenase
MAMTEPQAGSDTGNIQTTATFDPATNEWIINGQKIFCTSGKLALEESDGMVVVWATVDKKVGRAGMKPFVVEAGTPGVIIAKVEEKLGIRASDTPRSSSTTRASRRTTSWATPKCRPAPAPRASRAR